MRKNERTVNNVQDVWSASRNQDTPGLGMRETGTMKLKDHTEIWAPVTGSRYARGNGLLLHPIQVTLSSTVLCVQVSTVYTKCFYFLLPQMRLTMFIDLDTVTLQPKVQATLCTLDPLSILRNDSSSFYQSHVGAHSGTDAPLEDTPLGDCSCFWGVPLSVAAPPLLPAHPLTPLPSPAFRPALPVCLSFPTPLQLAAVLLPLCSWALLVSTNILSDLVTTASLSLSDFPQACGSVSHSSFYKHLALVVFLPLHWSCLFSWLILICPISRCTWKPCLYQTPSWECSI